LEPRIRPLHFSNSLLCEKFFNFIVNSQQNLPVREEWRDISDADTPPTCCPSCGAQEYTRSTYYFRDLQELGSLALARKVRYEAVTWKCKHCQILFAFHNPMIPLRTPYMPEIVEYAKHRVIKKGDSARRVAEDLKLLHNVTISEDTILTWVNPKPKSPESKTKASLPPKPITDFTKSLLIEDFSGVLAIDGTFKAVKAKKNEHLGDASEPLLLHLTHLPDGRLVAYWQQAKTKKKSHNSSRTSK